MTWMDALWDPEARLLWTVQRDRHMTRDTAWYAVGLLERGDTDNAELALHAVCDQQLDERGAPWHGTWRRAPEEAHPAADAVMWIHFDPNWRQFIGTTFALILDTYKLGSPTQARLRGAIALALDGEPPGRIAPSYANIALLQAWLLAWAGRASEADAFAEQIWGSFSEHGAFLEYNSPTYYGIDLWALALWRSSTATLRRLGARMEEALWRDVARFYHAGMRTQCGPFDRAYGMDMTTHATPLGLWIWSVVGRERAPFPDPAQRFRHPHDFCFGPAVAAFEPAPPPDTVPDLESFGAERLVERVVTSDPLRVTTAWLSASLMLGGWSGPTSGIGWFQHHHATAHWQRPDGTNGWMRLDPQSWGEVRVGRGTMRVEAPGTQDVRFDLSGPPVASDGSWEIDGLRFEVHTTADTPVTAGNTLVYPATGAQMTFEINAL